jgi:hypothetical protein
VFSNYDPFVSIVLGYVSAVILFVVTLVAAGKARGRYAGHLLAGLLVLSGLMLISTATFGRYEGDISATDLVLRGAVTVVACLAFLAAGTRNAATATWFGAFLGFVAFAMLMSTLVFYGIGHDWPFNTVAKYAEAGAIFRVCAVLTLIATVVSLLIDLYRYHGRRMYRAGLRRAKYVCEG